MGRASKRATRPARRELATEDRPPVRPEGATWAGVGVVDERRLLQRRPEGAAGIDHALE